MNVYPRKNLKPNQSILITAGFFSEVLLKVVKLKNYIDYCQPTTIKAANSDINVGLCPSKTVIVESLL